MLPNRVPAKKPQDVLWVLLPIALYIILRLPPLIHQSGGQDEQFFSVPGLTVWQEGVPRIPYLPTRNRETFFAGSDRCLMALPPGLFYCQAIFFAVFPAGYPTSRLPLFVGGLAAIAITYAFARQFGVGIFGSVTAACLVAVSRPLLFTAIIARPDLLCVLCGLAIAMIFFVYGADLSYWRVIGVGVLNGLGILFHPFALVFVIQSAAGFALLSGSFRRRMLQVGLLGVSTAMVAAAWLPLILAYPAEFRSQFFSNVVDRAGPGLLSRLTWPFPYIQHHAGLLLEFAGPYQVGLGIVGLMVGSVWLWKRLERPHAILVLLWIWSSWYLTATIAGIHPTKGYWMYSTVFCFVLVGACIDWLTHWMGRAKQVVRVGMVTVLMLCMLPGAGLRSSYVYLRHWFDEDYHGGLFIAKVLRDLPKEGVFLADLSFVFDVYLSGRQTLLAQEQEKYWSTTDLAYDYMLLSWEGRDNAWEADYHGQLIAAYGDSAIPQKSFVNVYTKTNQEQ